MSRILIQSRTLPIVSTNARKIRKWGGTYRDFSSCSILHQIINGRTSNSSQPSLTINQAYLEIIFNSLLGDLSSWDGGVEKIFCRDSDVFATNVEGIGSQ